MIDQLILDFDTAPEVLSYNSLIHYKGKKKFGNVKSIEAKVNTEELTLSFLGPMFPNLERLRLNNSVISSIRDIGCNFPKLRFLSLAQCNITSLDGIATISPNLQELYLAGNKIPDLVDLMGMDHLKIIDLEDNGISKFSTIEILKFCDKLTTLTLKSNPIAIDPSYRKKIFQLLPKLSYLDETRPQMSMPVRAPPSSNSNVHPNTQKVQSPPTNKPTTQPRGDPSKQAVQQKGQKPGSSQQSKQVTQSQQSKQAVQQNKPKVDQTKQPASTKTENSQKVVLQADNNKNSQNNQNKKRPPSADNVKRAIQTKQSDSQPAKKLENPNTPPPQKPQQQQPSPRKLTDRNPRTGASSSRFNRPNTKLVVSKGDEKEPQKAPKPPIKPPVNSPEVSPRGRQANNRHTEQQKSQEHEESDLQPQFSDIKKPLNRTAVVSSAKKLNKKNRSNKNGEEIMTDMVQDMVDKNNADSKQNRSNLYERSAFPELNSLVVKKTPNKNAKPPEIIKPLSARGPVYV